MNVIAIRDFCGVAIAEETSQIAEFVGMPYMASGRSIYADAMPLSQTSLGCAKTVYRVPTSQSIMEDEIQWIYVIVNHAFYGAVIYNMQIEKGRTD